METKNQSYECEICWKKTSRENTYFHDGLKICLECWPDYCWNNGICENCAEYLEGIVENVGFEPGTGPTYYQLEGYKDCENCAYEDEI